MKRKSSVKDFLLVLITAPIIQVFLLIWGFISIIVAFHIENKQHAKVFLVIWTLVIFGLLILFTALMIKSFSLWLETLPYQILLIIGFFIIKEFSVFYTSNVDRLFSELLHLLSQYAQFSVVIFIIQAIGVGIRSLCAKIRKRIISNIKNNYIVYQSDELNGKKSALNVEKVWTYPGDEWQKFISVGSNETVRYVCELGNFSVDATSMQGAWITYNVSVPIRIEFDSLRQLMTIYDISTNESILIAKGYTNDEKTAIFTEYSGNMFYKGVFKVIIVKKIVK